MTIQELARLRSVALRAERRSPATLHHLDSARRKFEAYLALEGAQPPAEDVTPTNLRAFAVHLAELGLTPETQSYYVRGLRALFRWAFREELIPRDPGARVRPPIVPRKVMVAPDDDQVRALLKAARATWFPMRDRAIVTLLFDAGLRARELTGLALADVNWDFQQIRVLGKGQKERVVPVGYQTTRALAQYVHRERQAPGAVQALFVAMSGRPLTYSGLLQLLERLAARAGIRKFSPHKLRHGFARAYLRNGGDVFTLQKMLGHATLDMTRRYAELALEDVEAAHRRSSPADRLRST